MTISTTESSIAYNVNGVTLAFAVPFRFLVDDDIVVTRRNAAGIESTLVLNTDYTLTGANNDAGGTLTMVVAPAVGERLVIDRVVGITQETDYPEGGNFPAEAHERALDRLTMIGQQLLRLVSRCLQLPTSDTTSPVIPTSTVRANKFLAFDADGNATVASGTALSGVVVSPLGETLVGRGTAALMRGDLGAFPFARNYHQGFILSSPGSSTTMNITRGQCADSTNTMLIDLASPIAKTSGPFVAGNGNGGLDVGTISVGPWYSFYAIINVISGAADVVHSLSNTWAGVNKTLINAAGFTLGRFIGMGQYITGPGWELYPQVGDTLYLGVATTQAVTTTLTLTNISGSIPPIAGSVEIDCAFLSSTSSKGFRFYGQSEIAFAPSASDTAPENSSGKRFNLVTNNSGQIRVQGTAAMTVGVAIRSFSLAIAKGRDG